VTEALDRKVSELFVSFPLQETWLERAILSRLLWSAALAAYRFEAFRSKVSKSPLLRIDVAVPRVGRTVVREAMEWADAVVHGVVVARDLANQPPNEATPEALAETAAAWVRKWGGRAWVWSHRELKRRGFGALLAVGAGSQNPPCLLRAEWGEGTAPVGLVGKGVTFDSGGISLKPAERMDEMKWDKAGACTVLGVLAALAVRPLPVRVRLYLPFAENLPGGGSFRPGDILRCYNGLTVEITNTDAEGRLLLADALALAAEEGCNPIVDFATLTGACVVALGTSGAGLFANRETLAQALLEAGRRTGERLWQLPLWPEFREQMKGLHADLRNSGDRWGGACTAAAFLESFVPEPVAWAHLDIAGPAYRGRGESGIRGATGFGVATAYEWLDTHSAGVS
jgi:leucyl aminopeptidase